MRRGCYWHLGLANNQFGLIAGWWIRSVDPRRETDRLTRRLEALGHHVTLTPAVA